MSTLPWYFWLALALGVAICILDAVLAARGALDETRP